MRADATFVRTDRLIADLDILARFGQREDGQGIDRPAFSSSHRQAADWLMEMLQDAGLKVRMDTAGNVIGRLGPSDGPAVVCGSHIDSVPMAGKLDGTLGILAGLEAARCLGEEGAALNKALELVAFMDEEGTYLSEFGARAMIGNLEEVDVWNCVSCNGVLLGDAIEEFGLDRSKVLDAARPKSDFDSYVELHIEQGPVLENEGIGIGVVDSIIGLQVNELLFTGFASHAGTTPLPYRRDAFRAAAEIVTSAFSAIEQEFAPDLRLTYGVVDLKPGAQNVVPAQVRLLQEIRACREHAIDAAYGMTMQVAEDVCERLGVKLESHMISRDPAVTMSDRIIGLIESVCDSVKVNAMRMPSGAGHDAQILAQVCDAGMIFVPSVNGISHNPAEHTTPLQIGVGATVLYETLRRLLEED